MSFDLVEFIKNNIDVAANSIQFVAGAVASLLFLRKRASISTSTEEFEKIKAKKLGEAAEMLLDSGGITYSEFYKMKNYSEIAKKADKLLKEQDAEEMPQQSIDWHIRFFEDSGNISDEELQNIWARILAGEVYHPGSYSLRTLECLKNLSPEEAQLFKKVCDCSVSIGHKVSLLKIGNIITENDISYDDILRLVDCGLINSDVQVSMELKVGDTFVGLAHNDKTGVVIKRRKEEVDNNTRVLRIPQYLFSACGRELFSIVSDGLDIQLLRDILSESYKDYVFEYCQVMKGLDGDVKFLMTVVNVE